MKSASFIRTLALRHHVSRKALDLKRAIQAKFLSMSSESALVAAEALAGMCPVDWVKLNHHELMLCRAQQALSRKMRLFLAQHNLEFWSSLAEARERLRLIMPGSFELNLMEINECTRSWRWIFSGSFAGSATGLACTTMDRAQSFASAW
jgi:hypothetical protein